jgi:hypothetical protein
VATLKLIVQLVEDDGQVHQNEMDLPLSEFKDPDLVNEEDRRHAFCSTFGFLMKSLHHFVKYWRGSAESTAYFKRIEQYADDHNMGTADRMALMASSLNTEEGTRCLQLPLQVLEPQEGEDIPRPGFPSRYERKPVI